MEKKFLLGIDIGGTKCAVILGHAGEADEKIIERAAFPTLVERGWQTVIDEIILTADNLLKNNGVSTDEIKGIGISCGGPLDSEKGVIMCPPNLPDWDNVPIVEMFKKHFGVKTNLQNDANACAVAEWKYGAGRGTRNCIFLTFGTGMGAGLILDGRLYSGTNDMAGEVGHIRLADNGPVGYGKAGSFEGFCSGGGIARLADFMANTEKNMSAKDLAEQMKNGDDFSLSVYQKCAEKLGMGLSVLIDILNPEVIVIGSIYARNRDFFDKNIMPVIRAEALENSAAVCRILPAELGEQIGDFAALGLAEMED
ncbi:MAG: ROK family protein [Clostridia bacterium]|nr:ROK family protein [Clostridia bacterium]